MSQDVRVLNGEAVCERLEWDSDFFGRAIGCVLGNHADTARVSEAKRWAREQAIECLYFLAAWDQRTIRAVEEQGFRLADIRVTLEAEATDTMPWMDEGIRPVRVTDIDALRAIAGSNHADSRFYNDPNFPRAACDELYRTWIEKSCRGWADMVFVSELEGVPAGYLSCHLTGAGSGRIGLMGVAPEARGLRLGQKLVHHGLRWFASRGTNHVSVVTQGSNVRAQRLYQRCGFVTASVEMWYHCWLKEEEREKTPPAPVKDLEQHSTE